MATKEILLLGSGYVAGPCVDYLLRRSENRITIASFRLFRAQELASKYGDAAKEGRVRAAQVDVRDEASLDNLVARCDVVISLVPYIHHASVIKSAIKFKKNVTTTSYVSPAMMELDEAAKEAGIVVMNEIGLDPGVDHLYALKVIREVQASGGKINSFLSYCGGLPAPEASNNPLGYKFSWSSRGVLLALRNSAKFLEHGKVVEIPGAELMKSVKPVSIYPAFAVVGYANRDSSFYGERYNMPEATTVLRGSLRYSVFPSFVQALVDLGFLDETPQAYLSDEEPDISWPSVMAKMVGLSDAYNDSDLRSAILAKANLQDATEEEKETLFRGLEWLGLLSPEVLASKRAGNLLDTLCATLETKMAYQPGERDMVLLQHRFEITHADGSQETRTSTLLEYGEPYGYSAMARTVGVPCGIAVQLILDGELATPGILAPMEEAINAPLYRELVKENIVCREETVSL
ncbi:saccharopine dehydrogenase (NADP+, L-glutamate-forming), partial [Massospora cicadina]